MGLQCRRWIRELWLVHHLQLCHPSSLAPHNDSRSAALDGRSQLTTCQWTDDLYTHTHICRHGLRTSFTITLRSRPHLGQRAVKSCSFHSPANVPHFFLYKSISRAVVGLYTYKYVKVPFYANCVVFRPIIFFQFPLQYFPFLQVWCILTNQYLTET